MKLTNKEKDALLLKEANETKEVKCPRCGKTLQTQVVGNSYTVFCPTENCIKMHCRGL